jgi:ABC-2 type transport system ATP-binding protein
MIDHGKVIAQGTSTELKATIGGGVLELSLVDRLKLPQAMSLIKNLGVGEPEVDQISGHITISVEQGSKNLIEAIRILDGAGLEIADIELRKPSLDEVFIKLTGKGASEYDQR